MMERPPLYQEIAEAIRKEILYGTLKPDDELPTVREMSERWQCAPGTIQRAYRELARQGLVVSRTGSGTRVAATPVNAASDALRKATLANQAEAFLLSVLAAGYQPDEIVRAVQLGLDRWRTLSHEAEPPCAGELRFVGSHDPTIALIASRLRQQANIDMQLSFAGSLGGLIALAQHEADVAGSHLWDVETNSYNRAFVQRLMPGRRVALIKLADRHMGIIVAAGNPHGITSLADLAQPGVQFVNRQPGAGTRVWFDAQLDRLGIETGAINGYENEMFTHSEVAGSVADNRATAGIGIEAAALAYGLDFVPLATESYDLVIPGECWQHNAVQALVNLLADDTLKTEIDDLGGYDTAQTGTIEWIG